MWHFTQLALKNRWVTFSIVAILAVASIWAILGLKKELIPNIELPYTTVVTVYPQAQPDEVVNKVTIPIENVIWKQCEGKGLKHLYSTSAYNVSFIIAEFEYGTKMDEVTSTISQGIGGIVLPPGINSPQIIPIKMNDVMPLVMFSLSGDLTPEQLKEIADTRVKPALEGVKGVQVPVEIVGGEKEQVVIAPDPGKMNGFGISMSQIVAHLTSEYNSLSEIENTPMEPML